MMRKLFSVALAGGLLAVQTACGSAIQSTESNATPARHGSGVIISASQLAVRSGTILDAIIGRIANLRVERRPGRCPAVTLRGARTILSSPDPGVYVDGTHASDTCILHQIRASEVERIEIYPSGHTHRAGYTPNPNGLILVFLTGGETTAR